MTQEDKGWKEYFEKTKGRNPRPLLIESLEFVKNRGNALDLGSGALNDSQYLLSQGFERVIAVDKVPVAQDLVQLFPHESFSYVISSFEDFYFEKHFYDLINAQFSLPFTPPSVFQRVFDGVKDSLKNGGVFTGQLFGDRDGWNVPDAKMSFHTKEAAEILFGDMEILKFEEEEKEGATALGHLKHWHIFHVIARKRHETFPDKNS